MTDHDMLTPDEGGPQLIDLPECFTHGHGPWVKDNPEDRRRYCQSCGMWEE